MTNQLKRNYLEIKSLNELVTERKPFDNLNLKKVNPPDFQLNKFFYKEIGKKHKWVDRLVWSEQIYYKNKLDCEIAYFGILEEYFGKKLGGYLLTEAIKNSFIIGSKRVWVHTCSLDHKYALNNYLSRGMKVFKTETLNL